jgi:hypothetical protein
MSSRKRRRVDAGDEDAHDPDYQLPAGVFIPDEGRDNVLMDNTPNIDKPSKRGAEAVESDEVTPPKMSKHSMVLRNRPAATEVVLGGEMMQTD